MLQAEILREMLLTGNWFHGALNWQIIPEHPVLGDWCTLPFVKLFGITPEFTLGDKLIYAGRILWTIVWCGVFMVYTILWFSNSINDTHWLALWHAKIYVTLVDS